MNEKTFRIFLKNGIFPVDIIEEVKALDFKSAMKKGLLLAEEQGQQYRLVMVAELP